MGVDGRRLGTQMLRPGQDKRFHGEKGGRPGRARAGRPLIMQVRFDTKEGGESFLRLGPEAGFEMTMLKVRFRPQDVSRSLTQFKMSELLAQKFFCVSKRRKKAHERSLRLILGIFAAALPLAEVEANHKAQEEKAAAAPKAPANKAPAKKEGAKKSAKPSPTEVVEQQRKTVLSSAKSQQKVVELSDEAQSALLEYRQLQEELLPLRAQNAQMQKLVQSQREDLQSLERQVAEVSVVRRSLEPLLARMVRVLDDFVALDLPFLPAERKARSQALHSMLNSAKDSLPAQFRRILEAYQVEVEYGRSLEAYEDQIEIDGQLAAVEVLRVGRVALFYLTLDGNRAGRFDVARRRWVELGSAQLKPLQEAIAVAKKRIPPRLIQVPIEKTKVDPAHGKEAL